MSRPLITLSATYADGRTLDVLSDTISKRTKYLNETAFQSIHAIAIDALKSMRGMTRVARPGAIKVSVSPRTDLTVSYYTIGGSAAAKGTSHRPRRMCIRDRAGNRMPSAGTKFVFGGIASDTGVKTTRGASVYEFVDERDSKVTRYLICDTSSAAAKRAAKQIVTRRMLRYAGLAKRAMSALMVKTNTRGPADAVSARVYAKANEVTKKSDLISQNGDGGKYALILEDNLRYARRAVKGEAAAIDLAFKKAANMSIGRIKQKCGKLLLPGELPTPFPEVKRRK